MSRPLLANMPLWVRVFATVVVFVGMIWIVNEIQGGPHVVRHVIVELVIVAFAIGVQIYSNRRDRQL